MWPQEEDVVKVTNVIISDFLKSQTDLEWKGFCVSYSFKHRSKKLGHIWSSTLSSPNSQLPIILSKTPQRRIISKLGGYQVADRGFQLGLLPQKPVFFPPHFTTM